MGASIEVVSLGLGTDELLRGVEEADRAMDRLGRVVHESSRSAGAAAQPFEQLVRNHLAAADAGNKQHLSLRKVETALGRFTGSLLGVNPVIRTTGLTLGKFAAGSGWMLAILAGLALLGKAWQTISKESREADQAQKDAIKTLEDLRRKQELGVGGETEGALRQLRPKLRAQQDELAREERELARLLQETGADRPLDERTKKERLATGFLGGRIDELQQRIPVLRAAYAELESVVRLGETEVARLRKEQQDARDRERAQLTDQEQALQSLFHSLRDEHARLTMSADAYREYQIAKAAAAESTTKVTIDMVRDAAAMVEAAEREARALETLMEGLEAHRRDALQMVGQTVLTPEGILFTQEQFRRINEAAEQQALQIDAMLIGFGRGDKVQENADRYEEIWKEAFRGVENAAADMMESLLLNELRTLRDFADAMLATLARIAAHLSSGFLIESVGGSLASTAGAMLSGGGIPNWSALRSAPATGTPPSGSPLGGPPAVHVNVSAMDGPSAIAALHGYKPVIQSMVLETILHSDAVRAALRQR